jgi:butyryl-CoA dehydrogenase
MEALRYAGVRKQFGRPIGSFQGVSFQLADMAMEIEAGTHLLYHAAWLKQRPGRRRGRWRPRMPRWRAH